MSPALEQFPSPPPSSRKHDPLPSFSPISFKGSCYAQPFPQGPNRPGFESQLPLTSYVAIHYLLSSSLVPPSLTNGVILTSYCCCGFKQDHIYKVCTVGKGTTDLGTKLRLNSGTVSRPIFSFHSAHQNSSWGRRVNCYGKSKCPNSHLGSLLTYHGHAAPQESGRSQDIGLYRLGPKARHVLLW